ncbi:MAG: hypothetical protein H6706_18630 [Myxococcales bacterium]|nr:hypothetical protein [Myxococcales bacterium]
MSLTLLGAALVLAMPPVRPIDGIALSPHYENPAEGLTFDQMVDEIAAEGASHLSVVVQWAQPDVTATTLAPHPKESQPDRVIRRLIRRAHGRGLKVMVFPIIWVEAREVGEWRGTLAPVSPEAWWRSYGAFILHYARLAAEERAEVFSVGSELASMEADEAHWRALIADVRGVFGGQLLYSANWDHYVDVPFWDALDFVGLTAYYTLTDSHDPSEADLTAAWQRIRGDIMPFIEKVGRPLVFTELGYVSQDGVASAPWDYTRERPVDLEEQRRCFAAFAAAWQDEPALGGVFFWNWWGPGGPTDRWYTLKGKPALEVVRAWLRARLPAEKDK